MRSLVTNLDILRQLQRLLGLRGSPQVELAPSLMPVVNAFNLDDPPFHAKRGAVSGIHVAAVLGQLPYWRITNLGTGAVVVRWIEVQAITAASYFALYTPSTNPAPPSLQPVYSWDHYLRTDLNPNVELRYGSIVTFPDDTYMWRTYLPVGAKERNYGPWVIGPRRALEVYSFSAGSEAIMNFYADDYDR